MVCFLVFTECSYAEFSWFEQHWISDAEATMESHPKWKSLDEKTHTMVKAVYGKLQWIVADGIVQVLHLGGESQITYSYRPNNVGGYEVMMSSGEYWDITRTETGFCITMLEQPDYGGIILHECFKPYGT